MKKIKSENWVLEYPTMTEQGYILKEEDGVNYWIKD